MERYNWADIDEERLNAVLSRRAVHAQQTTVARVTALKGAVVPLHQHLSEQITMMESGVLRFDFPSDAEAGEFILRAGDILVIPPHMPHRVEALEDSVAMELFSPAREDWIRGDDGYLRESAPDPVL